jgi:MFS superfamily sulfate permease-like transporter
MFFANIDYMNMHMDKLVEKERRLRPVHVVVLSFIKVNSIDSTALFAFKELLGAWKKRNISVLMADAKGEVS